MTTIRTIALAAGLSMTCAAQAQTPAPGPQEGGSAAKFAARQRKELARIARRLRALQTLQACVQGVADAVAIKACNTGAHAAVPR
jgi:hypothetical protein